MEKQIFFVVIFSYVLITHCSLQGEEFKGREKNTNIKKLVLCKLSTHFIVRRTKIQVKISGIIYMAFWRYLLCT